MFGSRIMVTIVVVMVVVTAVAAIYYNQGAGNLVAEKLGYQSRMVRIKIDRWDVDSCGYRPGGVLAAVMNSSADFITRSWFHLDAKDGIWISFLVSLQGYEEMKRDYGDHPCYKF